MSKRGENTPARKKDLSNVKNVWRATLVELCEGRCDLKYIIIVNECVADDETLKEAVAKVREALCPWPAIRIAAWFFETRAGRKIAWAEWRLYSEDAISPSQAARLLWGKSGQNQLRKIVRHVDTGKLRSFFDPNIIAQRNGKVPKSGRYAHSTYVLRSEVLALIESGNIEPQKKRGVTLIGDIA